MEVALMIISTFYNFLRFTFRLWTPIKSDVYARNQCYLIIFLQSKLYAHIVTLIFYFSSIKVFGFRYSLFQKNYELV